MTHHHGKVPHVPNTYLTPTTNRFIQKLVGDPSRTAVQLLMGFSVLLVATNPLGARWIPYLTIISVITGITFWLWWCDKPVAVANRWRAIVVPAPATIVVSLIFGCLGAIRLDLTAGAASRLHLQTVFDQGAVDSGVGSLGFVAAAIQHWFGIGVLAAFYLVCLVLGHIRLRNPRPDAGSAVRLQFWREFAYEKTTRIGPLLLGAAFGVLLVAVMQVHLAMGAPPLWVSFLVSYSGLAACCQPWLYAAGAETHQSQL